MATIRKHGRDGGRTIFIYEYACAQARSAALPDSIRVEGRAMFACLVSDFTRVPGVDVVTIEDVQPATEKEAFQEAAARAEWSLVVAPEFDGLLQERARWLEEIGRPSLGGFAISMAAAVDKWATYNLLTTFEVSTPPTALASEENAYADWPLPWVCKPRYGAGSQGVALITENRQARVRPDCIVQPYVPGIPASVSFLVGRNATLPLLAGYQLLSGDGHFTYQGGRLPLPEKLSRRVLALADLAIAAAGPSAGFVGVDLVLGDADDGSEDFVIEINPRVTTSYIGLRALAKENIADVWLRLAEGERVAPIDWHSGSVSFTPAGAVNSTAMRKLSPPNGTILPSGSSRAL